MGAGQGLYSFQNSYEISPIILVGGIAGNVSGGVPGAMLPIASLLNAGNYDGLTSQQSGDAEPFARFRPMAGSTLIQNRIAKYPFANMTVAGNAVISDALAFSIRMVCPASADQSGVSYAGKLAVMTALQSALAQHTALGGWYNVATPSFIYVGCLLVGLVDVTDLDDTGQVQAEWRWDFEQPLISLQAAVAAQNQAMARYTAQTKQSGDPPGSHTAQTGVNAPSSNFTPGLVPAGAQTQGANAAPPNFGSSPVPLNAVAPIPPGT